MCIQKYMFVYILIFQLANTEKETNTRTLIGNQYLFNKQKVDVDIFIFTHINFRKV